MKIVHVASEFSPWMQVGDLGEVVGGLVRALAGQGHEVAVFLPGYRQVLNDPRAARAEPVFKHTLELGDALISAETLRVEVGENVTLYLVRRDESFDRSYPYGPPGGEYEDSDTRFLIFCKVVADALCRLDGPVDVLHCHDWPAALAPLYVRLEERKRGVSAVARTVLSIHQTVFQGIFPRRTFAQMNLPEELFATDGLEFYGQVNYLKGGILFADTLLAPSPAAAREMLGPDYGLGLEGVLARRSDDLRGLLTGVEVPAHLQHINTDGRVRRQALRELLGADATRDDRAIFATQMPLTPALSLGDPLELIPALGEAAVLAAFVRPGAGLAAWQQLAQARPGKVFLFENAPTELMQRVLGGADFFLGMTRIEPSPLPAQRAMFCGAIPVMAKTGAPVDVIVDETSAAGTGNGLLYEQSMNGCSDGVRRALALHSQSAQLASVRLRAHAVNSSWKRHLDPYLELYRELA